MLLAERILLLGNAGTNRLEAVDFGLESGEFVGRCALRPGEMRERPPGFHNSLQIVENLQFHQAI